MKDPHGRPISDLQNASTPLYQVITTLFNEAIATGGQDAFEFLYSELYDILPKNEDRNDCLRKLNIAIRGEVLYNSPQQLELILHSKDCAIKSISKPVPPPPRMDNFKGAGCLWLFAVPIISIIYLLGCRIF